MEQKIFEYFRDLIYRESGITLSDQKRVLLANRIQKRLRKLNLQSDTEYLKIIELDVEGEELVHLIDAISTNHTFFFREIEHFKLIEKVFTEWKQAKKRKARIWCAASSSGEEPYSIAMIANEKLDLQVTDFKMLATDICTTVLRKAIQGNYRPSQLKDVPPELIRKYFHRIEIDEEDAVQVSSALKKLILYKKLNLTKAPYPIKGPFDIIFCRNVMIYFDNDLRTKLVDRFYNLLSPGGYLIVGHSESLSSIPHKFKMAQSAVYKKEG
ncbi:MAG: protein-glutamate O-methyltransferase CheR [Bdellovibrionales bacterium]|nr:protein-glutamate O-methyltransferase CheR [Bdellovibrionales bacterium]